MSAPRIPSRKQPKNIGLTADQVKEAVRKHGGVKPAARALGVCRTTVRYWLDRDLSNVRRLVAAGKTGPAFGARGGSEFVIGRNGLRGRPLVEAVFESRACGRTTADEYEAAQVVEPEEPEGGAA